MIPREGIQDTQQVALGGGVDDLIDAGEQKRILRASFVEIGEVDTHTFLPPFLRHNDWVGQPIRVSYLANDPCSFQLAGLLDDESLLFRGLPPCLLLHGANIGAHVETMLDYASRDPRQLIGLPCEYLLVRAQELDEGLLLLGLEVGAYGEGGVSGSVLVDRYLLGFRLVLGE